jgi:hypothetical protein
MKIKKVLNEYIKEKMLMGNPTRRLDEAAIIIAGLAITAIGLVGIYYASKIAKKKPKNKKKLLAKLDNKIKNDLKLDKQQQKEFIDGMKRFDKLDADEMLAVEDVMAKNKEAQKQKLAIEKAWNEISWKEYSVGNHILDEKTFNDWLEYSNNPNFPNPSIDTFLKDRKIYTETEIKSRKAIANYLSIDEVEIINIENASDEELTNYANDFLVNLDLERLMYDRVVDVDNKTSSWADEHIYALINQLKQKNLPTKEIKDVLDGIEQAEYLASQHRAGKYDENQDSFLRNFDQINDIGKEAMNMYLDSNDKL